jgi:hypothetical protein
MATFTKPTHLNGAELRTELRSQGIEISDDSNAVKINENGLLILDIKAKDETKANAIVAAHNGTTIAPEPTISQKLASVGLSIDELKAALGV